MISLKTNNFDIDFNLVIRGSNKKILNHDNIVLSMYLNRGAKLSLWLQCVYLSQTKFIFMSIIASFIVFCSSSYNEK